MAPWVKALNANPDNLEFILQNPQGRRRISLPSTHTHKIKYNLKRKLEKEKSLKMARRLHTRGRKCSRANSISEFPTH